MPLILGANSLTGGYEVDNSLRFNSGSSDSLARTFASTGNRQIWTLSFWLKRSSLSAETYIIQSLLGGGDYTAVFFNSSNNLIIDDYISTRQFRLITTQVFRDTSAWYHIIIAIDTTQATSSNRVKMYVNGSQVTVFSTETYPAQNTNGFFNQNRAHNIGINTFDNSSYFGGYLSEFNFIDGQQLDPTDFGEFDEDSGIWKPIAYTGTYGTNGFYLEFQDSSALGDDTSGNGNTFTVNNLTSIDQTTDTPTNNFCTLNPLDGYSGTLSEGNLKLSQSSFDTNARGTIGLTAGKWYWEIKMGSTHGEFGVCEQSKSPQSDPQGNFPFYFVYSNGSNGLVVYNNATSGSNSTINAGYTNFSASAICMIAYDADNGKLYVGLNGTWYNSGDPASGTGFLLSGITTQYNGTIVPFFGVGTSNARTNEINFGNPPFTISSGNSDENGIGLFEYSVPSGYYSLCTKNLSTEG